MNRWPPRLAGMTMSRISTPVQKLHYDPIEGLCPPDMRSCLPNVHSASVLGSSNSIPTRPLHRFYRSIRRNKRHHFPQGCSFWGPENEIFHFDAIFHKNRKMSVDFRLKTGLINMGLHQYTPPKRAATPLDVG